VATYDSVVVGSGLAGLTAAAELTKTGANVVVLEARHRVGGRTVAVDVGGAKVDGGGSYLGYQHTELLEIIHDLGLATFSTAVDGDSIFRIDGQRHRENSRLPPLNPIGLGDLFEALHEISADLDLDEPLNSAEATRLNELTAARWLDERRVHSAAKTFFPMFFGQLMAADPGQVSALHMAFYLKSGGGLRYLNAFEGGAQELQVVDGVQRVSEGLAARLGDIHYGQHVCSIEHQSGTVTVSTDTGDYRAETVIMAIPPQLVTEIVIDPEVNHQTHCRRFESGAVVKVHFVYDRPLWRELGLSGWSLSDTGPVTSTVDGTPSSEGAPGVLTGFVTGESARRFSSLPPRERQRVAVGQIRSLFPELPAPRAYFDTDWITERYSSGCYAALLSPGRWATGMLSARRSGNIIWAGTETSNFYFGLMEGAARSGKRAAAEAIEVIGVAN
jgi:monoamine oxidase